MVMNCGITLRAISVATTAIHPKSWHVFQSSLVFHQKRLSTSGTSQLLRKVDEQRNVSQVPFPGIRRPKFGDIVVPTGFFEGKLPTFATCLKFPVRQVQVPLETMTTTAALTQSLSVKCVKLLEASAASHGSN